jgi:Flp pilus assembly protein TadD
VNPTTTLRCFALTALAAAVLAGAAEARNPHCAGGIQYVVQAMNDKSKNNMEDYTREINKAVQQLEQCRTEDPNDFEAIGYLGWAYAEIDSMSQAGKAFDAAIKGLEIKDPKKKDWAINNRNSYWAKTFNDGIAKIRDAQTAYPEFCKKPESDADKGAKGKAEESYRSAAMSLNQALGLKPGDPQTIRNLASVYALTCDYQKAEGILREGLKVAPTDTMLLAAVKMVRVNYANQLAEDKKYDEAIAFFGELLKAEPTNADLWLSQADVLFRRAQSEQPSDQRKKDFASAGDSYAKASELRPNDADLAFNAGVAYQNAQMWDKSEAMWKKAAQLKPDDPEVYSSWGSCQVELKRCPEAIVNLHKAVDLKPQDKSYHRQLGAIYTKCGNNTRGTDELMVYLAMQNGQAVPDAAAIAKEAKQGTDAAKTLASDGAPEQIYRWEADNQKFDTWFYWGKKRAYTFNGGGLTRKSDWGAPDTKSASK